MRTKILLLSLILICSSCSSLKRTILASGLIGGVVGGMGGAIFSPERESRVKNAFLFSVLGAGVGALGGYLLHDKPIDQQNRSNMLLDQEEKKQEVPLFDFSPDLKNVKPQINFKPIKKYEVPQEKLPPELQGKAKKQYVLEYESEAQTIKIENRTIQISPFKAWENVYEE